jgi:membrane protease YdiL (CAAX protease family)
MPDSYAAEDYRPPGAIRWNGWWFLLALVPGAAVATLSRTVPLHLASGVAQVLSVSIVILVYCWAAGAAFLASRFRGLGTLRGDFGWTIVPIDIAIGAVAAVVLFAVALVLSPLARAIGPVQSNIHLTGNHFWDSVGVFLVPTVVAAPVEEILFRGLLMRWIRIFVIRHTTRLTPGAPVHLSVFISATTFALIHLYEVTSIAGVINLGLQTFALGVITGYLATRTGRLGSAVVAHGIHNAVSGLLALAS